MQQDAEAISVGNATPSEELFNRDVGLTEVLQLTGRNKSQISKDTNSGRLPSTRNEQGHRRYQVRDLYQIYGFRQPKQTAPETPKEQPQATGEETAVELAVLRREVETLKRENQDLRQDKERLWETTQQLTGRLLAAPAAQPMASAQPAESTMPAAPPKTLWQRIMNK